MSNQHTSTTFIINRFHEFLDKKQFIAEEDLILLANETGLPLAELHGLLSFFTSLRTRKPGKNRLSVCCGTPCYARGAETIYKRLASELELDEDGTSLDGLVTLEKVQCVGACSLAPVISINGKLAGNIKPRQAAMELHELINQSRLTGEQDKCP